MNYRDPAEWDDLWENEEPQRILVRLCRSRDAHPDWHARYAHALAMTGQLPEALDHAETALEMYEGQPEYSVAMLRAVILILKVASRRYNEVISTACVIYGSSPLIMEANCYTQSALAHANLHTGELHTALLHLGQAMGVANALDLPHRRRALQIIWTHILTAMGQSAPHDVLLNIASSPHKATASTGAARIVESYMYAGDYHLAAKYAESKGLEDIASLAHALMGTYPNSEPAELCLGKIAYGLKMASELRYEDIPVLPFDGTNIECYGQLLNAIRSLGAGSLSNFKTALGNEPTQPDQRAYWHSIRLFGILDGALEGNASEATKNLTDALLAAPNTFYVVRTIESVSPRAALLLSHAPDPRLHALFSGLTTPLLINDYITNNGRVPITPVMAEYLIAESVGQKIIINGGYKTKYRITLGKKGINPSRVITIGDIYKHASDIASSATGTSQAAWHSVMIGLRRNSPILDQVLSSKVRD